MKSFPEEVQAILDETREQYRDLILAVEIKSIADARSFYKAIISIPEVRDAVLKKFGISTQDLLRRGASADPLQYTPGLDAVVRVAREAIQDQRFHA